jgi:hypothetical protein
VKMKPASSRTPRRTNLDIEASKPGLNKI